MVPCCAKESLLSYEAQFLHIWFTFFVVEANLSFLPVFRVFMMSFGGTPSWPAL